MLILLVFDKAPMKKSIFLLLTTSECFIDYIIFSASIRYAGQTVQLTIQNTFKYA